MSIHGWQLEIPKGHLTDTQAMPHISNEILPRDPNQDDEDVISKKLAVNEQNNGPRLSKISFDNGDELLSNRTHGRDINQDQYSKLNFKKKSYQTKGMASNKDGRLDLNANETSNRGYLAKALGLPFSGHVKDSISIHDSNNVECSTSPSESPSEAVSALEMSPPILNIVVMVIGSRGDIQPFIRIGKKLKDYGHRVRIATHPAFKKFIIDDSNLEFFSVGGDPAELMAFMVKNPGIIPTMETLRKGEVGRRREQMAQMFGGFWRACINATDSETDHANLKMMNSRTPFIADAIIANPPSFAHIHCAERLGIPLHLMFTFPYTPTQAFPHPLSNIKQMNIDPGYANFMSYPLVEMMAWQGLGDLVNNFRVKTLGLEPVSTLWGPGQLYRLKVPHTYLWSPRLVPKPHDWGHEINITGFVYLGLASSFDPPKELLDFLDKGPPPIYIGFGSIVIEDPEGFTEMIFDAVQRCNIRALVSKGWGNLGGYHLPDNIFLLENIPHDWVFPRVSAVVHHGGAGSTAAGMKFGKPTMIIPFFGDQHFWGHMIDESGAGPSPIPHKDLSVEKLVDGIKKCLRNQALESAQKIAKHIEAEGDGAANAVSSFHRSLVLNGKKSMRCSLLENRVAVWNLKKKNVRLCALAAEILLKENKINQKQLQLIRHSEWNDFEGPGEPLTGGATALLGTVASITTGILTIPYQIGKKTKQRVDMKKNKKKLPKQKRNKEKKNYEIRAANGEIQDCECSSSARFITETQTATGELCATTNLPSIQNQGARKSSADLKEPATLEVAHIIESGLVRTTKTIIKAPMDLSLAVAQGLHNAPRLYGDETVRRPVRIDGIKSGLRAAGEEFIYGIYDGVTGLVVQPYTGARNHGTAGAIKGVGMGLTGFILKDLSAIIGPLGYTLKGVHKEISSHKQPINFIRRSRILEGHLDLESLNRNESIKDLDIVCNGWSVFEQIWSFLQKKRTLSFRASVHLLRQRKELKNVRDFDNLRVAHKVLETLKNGEIIDETFVLLEVPSEKATNSRE